MIKTVIFDIGNVLVDFSWEPYIREILGAEKALMLSERIWSNRCWHELDLGLIDEDEIIQKFIADLQGYEQETRLVLENIGDCMTSRYYAKDWINQVKALGCRVLYLSNYSNFLIRANPGVLDFIPLTDGGIFSCDVGLAKPDKDIYAAICEKYRLNPAECLFIDDKLENIEAAVDFGMSGIQFMNYEADCESVLKSIIKPNKV